MITFIFTADITFKAKNIDGAFRQLEYHFKALRRGDDMPAWFIGEMHIIPVDDGIFDASAGGIPHQGGTDE